MVEASDWEDIQGDFNDQLLLQKCSRLQELQQDPMGKGQLLSFRERGSTGRTERGDLAASLNTKNLQLDTLHSLAQRSPPETGTVSVLLKLAQSILSAQIEVLGSGLSIKEVPEWSCFRCRGIFCKDVFLQIGGEDLCLSSTDLLMVMAISPRQAAFKQKPLCNCYQTRKHRKAILSKDMGPGGEPE